MGFDNLSQEKARFLGEQKRAIANTTESISKFYEVPERFPTDLFRVNSPRVVQTTGYFIQASLKYKLFYHISSPFGQFINQNYFTQSCHWRLTCHFKQLHKKVISFPSISCRLWSAPILYNFSNVFLERLYENETQLSSGKGAKQSKIFLD